MGTLTLAQLRTELLFDLRQRTDRTVSEGVTDDRLNMWINAGYQHVTHPTIFRHRELMHRYSITLVNGVSGYTFTPFGGFNILSLRSVAHVFGASDTPTTFRVKLLPKDTQWLERRTVTLGAPREFYIEGDSMYVSPVPNFPYAGHILAIRAFREALPLAADGDTTVMRPLWDEIVLLAARWRAELHLGYREMAEGTKTDFVAMVNEYKSFEDLQGEDEDWSSGLVIKGYMAGAQR